MKKRFLLLRIAFLTIILMPFLPKAAAQNVYYFDGSGSPHLTSRWWSNADFTGTHPSAFNGGKTYCLPKGIATILTSGWDINGSGTRLLLDTGAWLNLKANMTIATGAVLEMSHFSEISCDTFSVSGGGNLDMKNARIRFGKNGVTLPELTGSYTFSGSVVEICGNGTQTVRGNRSYSTLAFTGVSGVKFFSAVISGINTLDSISITGQNVVNLENRTIGGSSTRLYMTAGSLVVSGGGAKPDMAGTYWLNGGEIVFAGSSATIQTVRGGINYFGLKISGTNVGTSSAGITIKSGGSFTIDSGAIWNMTNTNIGITADSTVGIFINGSFKVYHANGLFGTATSAVRGTVRSVSFGNSGLVDYCRAGSQALSNLSYQHLRLSGSGDKTGAAVSVNGKLMLAENAVYAGSSPILMPTAGLVYESQPQNSIVRPGLEWPAGNDPYHLTVRLGAGNRLRISSDVRVRGNLDIQSGILDLDSMELHLSGNVSGSGTIRANGNSSLMVDGNADFGQLLMDQTDTGVSNALQNLEINLPVQGSVDLGNTLVVKSQLRLQSGTLNADGFLELSAEPGGSYAQVRFSGGNVSGKVQCETWITGSAGWRYLSSPVKTTLADLADDVPVSLSRYTNVFKWNASGSNWIIPPGLTSVWDGANPVALFLPDSVLPCRLRVSGNLSGSPVVNSLHYDSSGNRADFFGMPDGWNMIGNPYPFTLDWNKVYPGIGGTANTNYYIFNPSDGSYYSHNGSSGHSALSGGIAPFQAFFVKLNQPGDTISHGFNFDSSQFRDTEVALYKRNAFFIGFKVTGPGGKTAEAGIGENPHATKTYDLRRDAFFLGSDPDRLPVVYTRWEEKAISTKYLPALDSGFLAALEIIPSGDGKHLLSGSLKNAGEFEVWIVGGIDVKEYNLSEAAFEFNGVKGQRYTFLIELRPGKTTGLVVPPRNSSGISVTPSGEIILPESWPPGGSLKFYDMSGRLVSKSDSSGGWNFPGGWYLLVYEGSGFYNRSFIFIPQN